MFAICAALIPRSPAEAQAAVETMLWATVIKKTGTPVVQQFSHGAFGAAAGGAHLLPDADDAAICHDDDTGNLILTEARLDEADELRKRLSLPRDVSMSRLLLNAWQRWGSATPQKLYGEFNYLIWDDQAERLHIARDPYGQIPLFVMRQEGATFIASEPAMLLSIQSGKPRACGAVVADYLLDQKTEARLTPFEGVERVMPGHVSVFSVQGDLHEERWWNPTPFSELGLNKTRAHSEAECVEALTAVLDRSVANRMEPHHRVLAQLSGGIDSPTLLATFNRLDRAGHALPDLKTISLICPGLDCDESPLINDVTAQLGYEALSWDGREFNYSPPRELAIGYPQGEPQAQSFGAFYSAVEAEGATGVMSGYGGDQVFGEGPVLADLVRHVDLKALRGELGMRPCGTRSRDLADAAPMALPPGVRKILRRMRPVLPESPPEWAGPELTERWASYKQRGLDSDLETFGDLTRQHLWRMLDRPSTTWVIEGEQVALAPSGARMIYPMLDRTIIEFVYALPYQRRLPRGWTKAILRKTAQGQLPESVLWRKTFSSYNELLVRLIECQKPTIDGVMEDSSWRSADWVDRAALKKMWLGLDFESPSSILSPAIRPVWAGVQMEQWSRNFLDGRE